MAPKDKLWTPDDRDLWYPDKTEFYQKRQPGKRAIRDERGNVNVVLPNVRQEMKLWSERQPAGAIYGGAAAGASGIPTETST